MRSINVEAIAAELSHIKSRRMMVECTCERCKKTEAISYEDACENGRSLSNCRVPEGWIDAGYYPGLLCKECFKSLTEWMSEGANEIDAAPTVDAVEVVRCKDCRMYSPESVIVPAYCTICGEEKADDDFCSWGERKEENATDRC
jgi:hypothetical protein